ncbi:MAG: hypothetical protein ACRDRY_19825 [Pseudonocardiaceae bacterium]
MRTTPVARPSHPISGLPSPSDVVLSDISGATTLEMTEVESSDLVAQLNDAARSALFWPWCLALTMALMFLSPLLFLVGAPLTLWMFSKDRVRRTVVAFYDVHGAEEARRSLTRVAAELASSSVSRGKHKGAHVVEVHLDGERVGELTAAMSTRYKHLVVATEGNGNCACVSGRVGMVDGGLCAVQTRIRE